VKQNILTDKFYFLETVKGSIRRYSYIFVFKEIGALASLCCSITLCCRCSGR
jgi:hypothetical protein